MNGINFLQNLKQRNPSNIIISYLNINSIRYKFTDLQILIKYTFDIFTIAESKLDGSFPSADFHLQGYHLPPFRIDCTSNSGGLLTYVKSGIPARHLTKFKLDPSLHILPVELILRKNKLLVFTIYRPDRIKVDLFFETLSNAIHFYEVDYNNIIVVGDFNLEPTDPKMAQFLELNDMSNVIKAKTCFKTSKGRCIDLILTNSKSAIKNTGTVVTGLSDFHRLIYTMLKIKYEKLSPNIIKYRDYKNFDKTQFF